MRDVKLVTRGSRWLKVERPAADCLAHLTRRPWRSGKPAPNSWTILNIVAGWVNGCAEVSCRQRSNVCSGTTPKGPKDEVESAQKVVFTWQRSDWLTKEPSRPQGRLVREDASAQGDTEGPYKREGRPAQTEAALRWI